MWELLTCGGDIHVWELLTCGGDIHVWELLMCGGDIHMWDNETFTCGTYSHVEGTVTCGSYSYVEGTFMCGTCSRVEGTFTCGSYSRVEGLLTCGCYSHVAGILTCVGGTHMWGALTCRGALTCGGFITVWFAIARVQNVQEMPWPSQQLLAHNKFWEKQSFHRLLFLCLFGLFAPWYEFICDRFDCKQYCHSHAGIFLWNFDHFNCETVWNVVKSGLTCASCTQKMCSFLIDLLDMWNIQGKILITFCKQLCQIWRNFE